MRIPVVLVCLMGLFAASAAALPTFKEVRAAVTENPNDLRARYLLGKYYVKMGEFENALNEWKYIVKVRPNLWKIYNRIGLIRYKMGEQETDVLAKKASWKKALRVWEYVLRNNADDRWAKSAYLKVKARIAALDSDSGTQPTPPQPPTRTVTPDKPDGPDPSSMSAEELDQIYRNAYSLYCNEKWDEAIPKFELIARSSVKAQDGLFYLGNCYLKQADDPSQALEQFQRYKEKYGEDGKVLFAMGAAHGLTGQFQKQIDCFERSLQFDPDDPETHFQLALAYDKVDKPNKTVEHAQRAVQLDAGFKKRLQPLIKNSKVARRIGNIITDVLRETETSQLSDEQIDEYARRVGEILGEENINPDGKGGDIRNRMRGILNDPGKRQALGRFMDSGQGADDLKKLADDAGVDEGEVESTVNKFDFRRQRRK